MSLSPLPEKSVLIRVLARALRSAAQEVRLEVVRAGMRVRRGRDIRSYLRTHSVPKLHLGAGPNLLPDWLNTDLSPVSQEMIFVDVTERLPFRDGVFGFLFSEHLIEHLPYQTGVEHLKECFRVLYPGGKLRVATPDLQFLMHIYSRKELNDLQAKYITWSVERAFPGCGFEHPTFVVNNFFRCWGHQFIYDCGTLMETLRRAGFTGVQRFDVGDSGDVELRNVERHGEGISDDFNRLETMVVEGTRPR